MSPRDSGVRVLTYCYLDERFFKDLLSSLNLSTSLFPFSFLLFNLSTDRRSLVKTLSYLHKLVFKIQKDILNGELKRRWREEYKMSFALWVIVEHLHFKNKKKTEKKTPSPNQMFYDSYRSSIYVSLLGPTKHSSNDFIHCGLYYSYFSLYKIYY